MVKLDAMLVQNLLNHGWQLHHRMKWLGLMWLNPVRGIRLHVNHAAIPRMLRDNLAFGFGDAVRPKANTNLDHLFAVPRLSAWCV